MSSRANGKVTIWTEGEEGVAVRASVLPWPSMLDHHQSWSVIYTRARAFQKTLTPPFWPLSDAVRRPLSAAFLRVLSHIRRTRLPSAAHWKAGRSWSLDLGLAFPQVRITWRPPALCQQQTQESSLDQLEHEGQMGPRCLLRGTLGVTACVSLTVIHLKTRRYSAVFGPISIS